MLNVQNNFSTFEAHIVQTIQQGIAHFTTAVTASSETNKAMLMNMTNVAQSVKPLYEWHGFVRRNNSILIDPNVPNRSIETVGFSNQNHASTAALIQGSLERKSGLLKKYDASYYVVTPSGYLHEFKNDDFLTRDPSPEMSLYLPDCVVGAINNGNAFNVRGKDASKGSIGSKLTGTHEFAFRAHSERDAEQWVRVLREMSGAASSARPNSTPASPISRTPTTVGSRVVSAQQQPLSPRVEQQQMSPRFEQQKQLQQQQYVEPQQQQRYDERDENSIPYPQHSGYGNQAVAVSRGEEYGGGAVSPVSVDYPAARSGVSGQPGQY